MNIQIGVGGGEGAASPGPDPRWWTMGIRSGGWRSWGGVVAVEGGGRLRWWEKVDGGTAGGEGAWWPWQRTAVGAFRRRRTGEGRGGRAPEPVAAVVAPGGRRWIGEVGIGGKWWARGVAFFHLRVWEVQEGEVRPL